MQLLLKTPPPYLSRSGHLLEGLKQEAGNLNFYYFVHVERNCNEADHILAKSGAASLPACIIDVVTREQRVPRS